MKVQPQVHITKCLSFVNKFNKCMLYSVLTMLRLLLDSISSVLVLVQKQRHVEVYHLKIRLLAK